MTRAEKIREAERLHSQGFTWKEVAAQMGFAYSTVRNWRQDPDLSKQRNRRKRYGVPCQRCGKQTDGSRGYSPSLTGLCDACVKNDQRRPCGTHASYQRGCRCDDCRRANADRMRRNAYWKVTRARTWKVKSPPKHGTPNGYNTYGCRCDACKEAAREYRRSRVKA